MSRPDQPARPAIRAFGTWQPFLRALRDGPGAPGSYVAGRVNAGGGFSWSAPPGREPAPLADARPAAAAVASALAGAGLAGISYIADFGPHRQVTLDLLDLGPAVEVTGGDIGLGSLLLADGALPALWRRQPAPVTQAAPAASADPGLLERLLRGRLPAARGASEADLAQAGARLGMPLPAELRAVYRAAGAQPEGRDGDRDLRRRVRDAVGCDLLPLAAVHAATPATRPLPWSYAALEAGATGPDDPVQALAGSPGWLVFGGDGAGDQLAVDLTPGPGGSPGQVIVIAADENCGAGLIAGSLTGFVLGDREQQRASQFGGLPAVARVNRNSLASVGEAVSPDLEVLSVGARDGGPVSLAPLAGLPRLRTLTALAGTLADPLEIGALPGLEYLELGTADWRALLRAGAVPRGLLAAGVEPAAGQHPLEVVQLANELLARRGRPPVTRTALAGRV